MSPSPTRDTRSGQAYNDVRNLAKRAHRDVGEYLTMYTLEGLLSRLAISGQQQDFVLKGGVLMAAFTARRPTRDLDFRASGFPDEVEECVQRIRYIATLPLDDGLVFDPESIHGQVIRDEGDYSGVRVYVNARLASARIAVHADVNFADPVWPAPVIAELPRILGGTLPLLSYPDHMVLAEKIVTAIERGPANTRWRDFADIDTLTAKRVFTADTVGTALRTVADFRHITLQPLSGILSGMVEIAQTKWAVWRHKQRLEDSTPEAFSDVLLRCISFTDPLIEGTVTGLTWDPQNRIWQ